jgi:hypothetical protein
VFIFINLFLHCQSYFSSLPSFKNYINMSSSSKRTGEISSQDASSKRACPEETPAVRETHSLPVRIIAAESPSGVIDIVQKLIASYDQSSELKYPVIIGSRAASFWLPSFRPFEDWDIVATPKQALDMVNDLVAFGNKLSMSLIQQPLDSSIIKHKPLTNDIEAKINALPTCLYKILGEVKDTIKFEIELALVKDGLIDTSCSAGQILNLSNRDDAVLLNFPVGPTDRHQCVVASIEMLEVIKCSHIYWPFYFPKHIADLHTLRALLPSASPSVNLGIRADKTKPLTPPARSAELEGLLTTRTLETEAFRGTPGAHINLNVSNEDFLGRDDDLFVTRHVPHDDVHHLVKYGETPIYDQMKTDKSKAMISRSLFEQAPYQTQLHCVKEEAMVIALERYLLPKYALDSTSAYKSALIRICTTLTKGWFRLFAVDNFPRLAVCDKNLLPIRDEILKKHPLPPRVRGNPSAILRNQLGDNLDDLYTVEKLTPQTRAASWNDVKSYVTSFHHVSTTERALVGPNAHHHSSWYERDYGEKFTYSNEDDQKYWFINSFLPNEAPLIVSFISSSSVQGASCDSHADFNGSLYILQLKKIIATEVTDIESIARKAPTIKAHVSSSVSPGSWGGEDIWSGQDVTSHPVQEQVDALGLQDLTQDLFMTYVIALVQPRLLGNGDTPLAADINRKKVAGRIPVKPQSQLWFDLWKYNLNN